MVKKRKRPEPDTADNEESHQPAAPLSNGTHPGAAPQSEALPAPEAQLGSTTDDLVSLHRARFVPWQPTAVVASATSTDGSLVAVAHESGAIEIWETSSWTCRQVIPGKEDACISCLAWVRDPLDGTEALISGGLDGILTEWDLVTRLPRHLGDSFGGAIWDIAVQPASPSEQGAAQTVALACDDGTLRLFTAEHGTPRLMYHKSMPRLGGRLLSVAWHPNGQAVVTGTAVGTLHAWHIAKSQELMRISIGDGSGKEHCVWKSLVLCDGTMVTGDSGGNVQFWDAQLGTRTAAFQVHAADVLAMAASPAGDAVFAAGIDPQLALYKRVPGNKGKPERWVHSQSKRPHTHDVRALCVVSVPDEDPVLVSGGNDAQLLVHSVPRYTQESPVRVSRCPQAAILRCAGAAQPALLLSAQGLDVHVWQLGAALDRQHQAASLSGWEHTEGYPVDVVQEPLHLAHIRAKGPGHLSAAAISPNGQLIAFSDAAAGSLRLYRLSRAEEAKAASMARLELPGELAGVAALAFVPDSSRLLVATNDARVLVIDPETSQVVSSMSSKARAASVALYGQVDTRTASEQLSLLVSSLVASADGAWAALALHQRVELFSLKSSKHHGSLPVFEDGSTVTAVAFTPDGASVAVANAANEVVLFEVATLQHTRWSGQSAARLPARLLNMPGRVMHISFCPDPSVQSAVMHTSSSLCNIDFGAPPPNEVPKRKLRRMAGGNPEALGRAGQNFRVFTLENPCLLCEYTSSKAVLLVERPWAEVMKAFPPPLYRHRYGT
ncbi:g5185 [Coccomyxa viridis]|uniref:G5185 protein n=1 Tax=Coccomyxa viridis TaxID=1274662 RepID=A0ABP1FXA7_9CHLO